MVNLLAEMWTPPHAESELESAEMGGRHHYVSQFHLRGFTDPGVTKPQEPWLWVGDCETRAIVRRSPKNFGWSRGLFDGPGGLADRDSTLESFLSMEVEGPAAFALRSFAQRPQGKRSSVPAEVGRYLAWAAARNLPMRELYEEWINNLPALSDVVLAEQPPSGFEQIAPVSRAHRMEHPALGVRDDVPSEDVERLRSQGWRLVLAKDDFLELVHLEAWYLQVRSFPRLRWIILDAPNGRHFIISDRSVVWGFDSRVDMPPGALRHPDVQLFATLTSSVALFAYHPSVPPPQSISYVDVNRVIASAAQQWIAGPTRDVVAEALSWRLDA